MELIIIVLYLVFAVAVAGFAHDRGRSYVAWLLLSLIVSPLLTALLVAISPNLKVKAVESSRSPCPHCAEQILRAAKICPHCRSPLDPGWSTKRRYQSRPA